MALSNQIMSSINKTVSAFLEHIAEEYMLDATILEQSWKDFSKKKVKKPMKVSSWHQFSKIIRPQIREEHPDWDFGTVSKEVGHRWSQLTVDEKNKYLMTDSSPSKKKSSPKNTTVESTDLTVHSSKKKSPKKIVMESPDSTPVHTPIKNNSSPVLKKNIKKTEDGPPPAPLKKRSKKTTTAPLTPLSSPPSLEQIHQLKKIEELRRVCQQLSLPWDGKKTDLVQRLEDHIKKNMECPSTVSSDSSRISLSDFA